MRKRGFTIIELLMVIAILSILFGIITVAVTASMRQARDQRTEAMRQTLESGITAYRQLMDRWPERIESLAEGDNKGTRFTISGGDYDSVMQELLKMSASKSAKVRVMDPVGLLVMRASAPDGSSSAVEFRLAAQKNGKYAKRMSTSDMTVVYQNGSGRAQRYKIVYDTVQDSVSVQK